MANVGEPIQIQSEIQRRGEAFARFANHVDSSFRGNRNGGAFARLYAFGAAGYRTPGASLFARIGSCCVFHRAHRARSFWQTKSFECDFYWRLDAVDNALWLGAWRHRILGGVVDCANLRGGTFD